MAANNFNLYGSPYGNYNPYGNTYNATQNPYSQGQPNQYANQQPQQPQLNQNYTAPVGQAEVQGRTVYTIPVVNETQARTYAIQDTLGFYVFVDVNNAAIYTRMYNFDDGGDSFRAHLNKTPPPPPPEPATMEDIVNIKQDITSQVSELLRQFKEDLSNAKHDESKPDETNVDGNGPTEPTASTPDKHGSTSGKKSKSNAGAATTEPEQPNAG